MDISQASAKSIAFMDRIIKGNTGYDWGWERWTHSWPRDGVTFTPGKEADCSSAVGSSLKAGYQELDLSGVWYTGNMVGRLQAIGFTALPVRGLSLAALKAKMLPGDVIINVNAHTELVGYNGYFGSASIDENGQPTGGAPGNQTGTETRWTPAYIYSLGWDYLLRPPAEGSTSGPVVDIPAGLAAHQRLVVGTDGINGRSAPNTSAPVMQILTYGVVGNFDGWIYGEDPYGDGNNVWFRGAYNGRWFWSGGFAGGADTTGLTNLNQAAPSTGIQQRITQSAGVNGRVKPTTASAIVQPIGGNLICDFDAYTVGEDPYGDGRNIWYRGAYGKNWFWAGAFKGGINTAGLARV